MKWNSRPVKIASIGYLIGAILVLAFLGGKLSETGVNVILATMAIAFFGPPLLHSLALMNSKDGKQEKERRVRFLRIFLSA
jgi:hypothetical protein